MAEPTPGDGGILSPEHCEVLGELIREAQALRLPRNDLVWRLADAGDRLLATVAALREDRDEHEALLAIALQDIAAFDRQREEAQQEADALREERDEIRTAFDRHLTGAGDAAAERDYEIRNLRERVRVLEEEQERLLRIVGMGGFQGDAPEELLLMGDATAGCDAWVDPQRLYPCGEGTTFDPAWATTPVRYVRADLVEQRAAASTGEPVPAPHPQNPDL